MLTHPLLSSRADGGLLVLQVPHHRNGEPLSVLSSSIYLLGAPLK